MPHPTSTLRALETSLILARHNLGRRSSGGHGSGCRTIRDRDATAATGVCLNTIPIRPDCEQKDVALQVKDFIYGVAAERLHGSASPQRSLPASLR